MRDNTMRAEDNTSEVTDSSEYRSASKRDLVELGTEAREEVTGEDSGNIDPEDVKGICISVSEYIENKLRSLYNFSEEYVSVRRCLFRQNTLHSFVSVDTKNLSDVSTEGEVYIDASADQFCVENNTVKGHATLGGLEFDDIPNVCIIEPDDMRKNQYYLI